MKKIFKSGCCALAFLLFPVVSYAQSANFKAGKSIDLFHNVLRELSLFYVDTVEIGSLVEYGMISMLDQLDPYTEYIPEEENENLALLTTGSYGGVGSTIKKGKKGVVVFSEPYEGYPAAKAGIVPGDEILEIDGVPTVGLSVEECSGAMKGKPDTEVRFQIKKVKTGEIIELVLRRARIHFSDIAYYGMVQEGIGYIRIAGFTQDGSQDLRRAFLELKSRGNVSKLILDLRGNGGGIFEESIHMLSLFLPRGTEVVSAKGRNTQHNVTYKTKEEALDVHIPIVVLVNRGTASSSEILAGAMQDLDRGVIVGTRTFGKGLVQAIRPLNYNAQLKITIAKYYTPSGRCVQAIDYGHRNEDGSVGAIPDSLIKEFRTKNGRSVFDGGGITPDETIEAGGYSRMAIELITRDLIWDYAVQYLIGHDEIAVPDQFALTDCEYDDFISFMEEQEFDSRSATEVMLDQLLVTAKREGYDSLVVKQLNELTTIAAGDKAKDLLRHKTEIKRLLEEEICCVYYYQKGRIRSILRNDLQLNRAIEILSDQQKYKRLLTPQPLSSLE
jgi:carboxyl-terminal processing protease